MKSHPIFHLNYQNYQISDENYVDIRGIPEKNKYRFFSTASAELLFEGIDVDLEMSYNPTQCKEFLMKELQKRIDMTNKDLLIYLAGGIPFLGGTLGNIYKENNIQFKPYIYGVLTEQLSERDLDERYYNVCNASEDKHKKLLSPLCESTVGGLCDIACLLGYLNNDGIKSEDFLKSSASLVRFPPLVTSMKRVIDNNDVTGRDIVTICSTLHTYFTFSIGTIIPPSQIFEYALRICDAMTHIKEIPEKLPITTVTISSNSEENDSLQFLRKLNQPLITYLWTNDAGDEFNFYKTEKFDLKALEFNEGIVSLTPIPPFSARFVTGASIIRGKDHSFLYVSESSLKGTSNQTKVDIIDPFSGFGSTVDLEDFCQQNFDLENSSELINPSEVQQVILFCLDVSESMTRPLKGNINDDNKKEFSRLSISTQYMTEIVDKIYGYKIPSLFGLMTFSDNTDFLCPFTPLISEFERKGLDKITTKEVSFIWDSLSIACDEIHKFTNDSNGEPKFPNAINRVIVISDNGELNSTNSSYLDIIRKCFQNRVVVDSIIFNKEEKVKQLASLSHLTGGVSFQVEDAIKGLHLINEDAFININDRQKSNKPNIPGDKKIQLQNLRIEKVAEKIYQKSVESVEYDNFCLSILTNKIQMMPKLVTPECACFLNQKENISSSRRKRILQELRYVARVMEKDNEYYDPDVIVLPLESNIDIWEVFIKSPEWKPYLGKWFFLVVTFPDLYPAEPPTFRFISIPFHMNISTDGRVCLNILDKGYDTSTRVINMIQELKQLFLFPSLDSPIQLEAYELYFNEDEKEYETIVEESVKRVGKDTYEEFIGGSYINKEIDPNFELKFDPEDKKIIEDRVKIPSGIIYERKELKQLVASNIHPICKITGKPINLTLEQIDHLETYDSHIDFKYQPSKNEIDNENNNDNSNRNTTNENCVKCAICQKIFQNNENVVCVMKGMYFCREDYDNCQKNKTLPRNFINEYCDKLLEETFNPFNFDYPNEKCRPEDIFITDEMIANSYHLNKNYQYFFPTVTIHFNESPEELDFKRIIEKLPSQMFIIWIERGSTFLTIAFIGSGLYEEIEDEFKESVEKLKTAMGEFIVGNFENVKIKIPNEKDFKEFFKEHSHNIMQNIDILKEIGFETIRDKVNKRFKNQNLDEKYDYFFKDENIALYRSAEEEVLKEIKDNSIEFIITGETIIANRYFKEYNDIKQQFQDANEGCVECFLYHGSNLKNHPSIVSENFKTPYEEGYTPSNDPGYFGKGIYATDNMFYASMYSNGGKNYLECGDKASVFCCRAIYNSKLCITDPFIKGSDYYLDKDLEIPQVLFDNYGIYKVLVGDKENFHKIEENEREQSMVVANEFVFSDKYQIIPISSFTIMRTNYFILWIDTESEQQKILDHNNELKILKRSVKENIYYEKSIENGMNLMKKKKYNKVKLILSICDESSCSNIINEANTIFNSNCDFLNYQNQLKQMRSVRYTDKFEYLMKFVENDLIYAEINDIIKIDQTHLEKDSF
ncbi:hypothetical protein M9Y10_037686 [Tritrichomonas musculus]|uniref:UBC core domain-containing protein n=1 Tax=Tritrichomonas musculus TaxID=1915356 RepID=A0ABR2GRY2_9EUKA